jgi:hypothetical protein
MPIVHNEFLERLDDLLLHISHGVIQFECSAAREDDICNPSVRPHLDTVSHCSWTTWAGRLTIICASSGHGDIRPSYTTKGRVDGCRHSSGKAQMKSRSRAESSGVRYLLSRTRSPISTHLYCGFQISLTLMLILPFLMNSEP